MSLGQLMPIPSDLDNYKMTNRKDWKQIVHAKGAYKQSHNPCRHAKGNDKNCLSYITHLFNRHKLQLSVTLFKQPLVCAVLHYTSDFLLCFEYRSLDLSQISLF